MAEDNGTNMAKIIPEWVLTFAGLIYATGFLIVFTFLERFGLKEAGSEFFKAKYMHVGILFLLFPIISIIPFLCMWLMKGAEDDQKFPMRLPSILLILNTLMVFYIIVAFAPPGFVMQRQLVIPIIFAVTLFGLAFLQYFIPLFIKEDQVDTVHVAARWLLCVAIALPLDIYSFRGLDTLLWEMIVEGGYSFLLFMSLIGMLI